MGSALLAALLNLSALAVSQGEKNTCCSPKGVKPWPEYNKVTEWEGSLAGAQAVARRKGKLVLFFQLVGDLDLEGC